MTKTDGKNAGTITSIFIDGARVPEAVTEQITQHAKVPVLVNGNMPVDKPGLLIVSDRDELKEITDVGIAFIRVASNIAGQDVLHAANRVLGTVEGSLPDHYEPRGA